MLTASDLDRIFLASQGAWRDRTVAVCGVSVLVRGEMVPAEGYIECVTLTPDAERVDVRLVNGQTLRGLTFAQIEIAPTLADLVSPE